MADDRNKKRHGEPVLDFHWDIPELSADKTYSTIIRINLSGWWEGGRPKSVSVSVYREGEKRSPAVPVAVQNGAAEYPLVGLEPGHHYLVVVSTADFRVSKGPKMILVPNLPRPKTRQEKALEREQAKLEREKVVRRLKMFRPSEPIPEPIRRIQLFDLSVRPARLDVVLRRVSKEGRPEFGEIAAWDIDEAGELVLRTYWTHRVQEDAPLAVASLHYFDLPRRIKFFLPDDQEEELIVDVPAKEKKISPLPRKGFWEAYRERRNKNERREPCISIGVLF